MRTMTILISLLLFCLFLSSCLPSQPQGVNQATGTVNTSPSSPSTSMPIPTLTATSILIETSTSMPIPTLTVVSISTGTFTLTPITILNVALNIPCNQATFIEDLTIPDGTQISGGSAFTKVWQIENTGSCTWTPTYLVIFDHGDLLGAPSSFNMPAYVNPGQTVDISVNLTAPYDQGIYEGFWRLEDPNGNFFGVGPNSIDFDVQIAVGNIQSNFEVRHVYMTVDNTSVTAVCPSGYPFTITADIWTNGAGDVVYRWEFSDGTTSDNQTLRFGSAKHKTVSTTFDVDETGVYWALIHTFEPNEEVYDPISFAFACTPVPPTSMLVPPTGTLIQPTTPIPPTRTRVPRTRTSILPTHTPDRSIHTLVTPTKTRTP